VIALTLFFFFASLSAGSLRAADQPKDELITLWIKEAFRADPRIDDARIEVSVDSGIVHLAGQVPDLASRTYADLEAKKITGVRGVINEIIVFVPTRSDTDIALDLRVVSPHEIDVESTSGHVVLRGTVPSFSQKRPATRDAQEVVGVIWMSNLLSVDTEWRENEKLREDIQVAMDSDSTLAGWDIRIRVTQGVVTLSGNVKSPYQKEHATEVASRILGVKDVLNDLEVSRLDKYSHTALEERLRSRLKADWETHSVAGKIDIKAKNGIATLSGEVNTWSEYEEAARVATLTDGIWEVLNRLRAVGVDYPWIRF
jgi:osmotically-inducible protein OsmY